MLLKVVTVTCHVRGVAITRRNNDIVILTTGCAKKVSETCMHSIVI